MIKENSKRKENNAKWTQDRIWALTNTTGQLIDTYQARVFQSMHCHVTHCKHNLNQTIEKL